MARLRSDSKYHNVIAYVDGQKFDSHKEARRFMELKLMEKAGEIVNLQRQVKYELIPKQTSDKAKRVIMPVNYYADFVYDIPHGDIMERVVEDVKGVKTPEFIIKAKLMLWRYGIWIKCV